MEHQLNMMFRVGLTGGIGSGKSTVTNMFEQLGAKIIDADAIVHELSSTGKPAFHAIKSLFGPEVVDENQCLRRQHIRRLIFETAELRNKLEAILHPLVRDEINRRLQDNDHPYCVISIPLLFETDSAYNIDRILVVDAPRELQISRTASRDGVERSAILRIIDTQMDRLERLDRADDIIRNDAGMDALRSQVEQLHKRYLLLAERKKTLA
jgi:dephospho-CoA kinase